MKPEDTVNKLLSEDDAVPIPAAPVPEPKLKVYRAVKADDLELSDQLDEFFGEASNDGSTMSIGDLEYISKHQQIFQAEIQQVIAKMQAVDANILILV